jgi:hypothetical protein
MIRRVVHNGPAGTRTRMAYTSIHQHARFQHVDFDVDARIQNVHPHRASHNHRGVSITGAGSGADKRSLVG